jgi:hypothetical protein
LGLLISAENLDDAMAEVGSVVEPGSIADDIGRESVAFVSIHRLILPIMAT